MMGPQQALLADGRLHLQHGPIDLVIRAWGDGDEVDKAYTQAASRFDGLLEDLVRELPVLRAPVRTARPLVRDPVARRMVAAVWPHRDVFVTPMAAVAGAVADELLAAMTAGRTLDRAYVNDGGDIALHLTPGTFIDVGIVSELQHPCIAAYGRIDHAGAPRGIATSGWRGRSQSRGIADAVTVFADCAAVADAAATLLANVVDVEHAGILRVPACDVRQDSDLGALPITVAVGTLGVAARNEALDAGLAVAQHMGRRGLLHAAFLSLQGEVRVLAPHANRRLGSSVRA